MDSSEKSARQRRPLHLSLGASDLPVSRRRINRRRSVDNTVTATSRSQQHSAHRVDPYRHGNLGSTSHRNSGSHQVSYPTSARYYASSSSSSRAVVNRHDPSNYSTHLLHHPLHHQVLPASTYHAPSTSNRKQSSHMHHDVFSQPQGLTAAVRYTLKLQAQKVADRLVNQSNDHRSNSRKGNGVSLSNHRRKIDLLQNLFILVMPVVLFLIVSHKIVKHTPVILDKATKDSGFNWKPNRKLNNRQCTLNMFIEKQEPDEFNPDFEVIKPGEKNKDGTPKLPTPPKMAKGGTYRTKGQVEVIRRFISTVADSFRPQAKVQQHLVFTGARDGGHLSDIALKFWPARGEFRTQLYVVSDPHDDHSVRPGTNTSVPHHHTDHFSHALEYGSLSAIEERFQNHKLSDNVHIFDSEGQKAGLLRSDLDDDDIVQLKQEEMFGIEDDEISSVSEFDDDSVLQRRNATSTTKPGYFSLKKMLTPFLELEDEDPNSIATHRDDAPSKIKHVIPYFHVDGRSASQKFEILQSAKPLLMDNTIVTAVVENSPDMVITDVIEFFRDVNYKTFLLGKRQIMRIDHLCPEILEEVLSHPYIKHKRQHMVRRMLQYFRIIPQEKDAHIVHPHPENEMLYPAFFVAIPRGRRSKEEMTIQHMYDLFGGSGGGGQIATANDRKAPGKKKKK